MDGIQFRVSDFIYAVKKRKMFILLLTVVGLIFGILFSGASYLQGSMSKNYTISSSAVVVANNKSGFANGKETPDISDFRMANEMVKAVTLIIQSDQTLNNVIEKMKLLGITPKDIEDNLKLTTQEDTPVIQMALNWRSSDEGVNILNTLMEEASKVMNSTLKVGSLQILDEPQAKYIVGGSLNVPIWGVMLMLGFMAGIGIAVVDMLLRPTLINIKDVQPEFGLETLGCIPVDNRYFSDNVKILSTSEEQYIAEESFSALSYVLKNRVGNNQKTNVIYFTSTQRKEGRTSVVANIAVQLSDMEKKVLLIDLDVANPGIGNLFLSESNYEHSLNALYKGECDFDSAVTTMTGYLDILPVIMERNSVPLDNSLFDMLKAYFDRYDYVLIDAPPVGEVSGTLRLNTISDMAVLVIGFDGPTKSDIKSVIEKMDKSGIRIIGCVINREQSLEHVNLLDRDKSDKKKEFKKKKMDNITNKVVDMTGMMTKSQNQLAEDIKNLKETGVSSGNIYEGIIRQNEQEVLNDEDASRELLKLGLESQKEEQIEEEVEEKVEEKTEEKVDKE